MPQNTRLSFEYSVSDSSVIEAPFNEIDIESETRSYHFAVNHPLWQSLRDEMWLGLILQREISETTLQGHPFSFSPGAVDGEMDITAMRIYQNWTHREVETVLSIRSQLSIGLDAFDSPNRVVEPDNRFISFLLQAQWAKRWQESGWQLLLKLNLQLADGPLLSMEQFTLGGAASVRGYRENQLLRDQGLIFSAEYRVPLLRGDGGDRSLFLAPFIDLAYGRNRGSVSKEETLSSIGLGFLWEPDKSLHAELYVAKAFQKFATTDHNL